MENSEAVQRDLAHGQLIRLQNEHRLLKEKSALEVEELRTVNAQLRTDVTRVERNLNIMTVSLDYSTSNFCHNINA